MGGVMSGWVGEWMGVGEQVYPPLLLFTFPVCVHIEDKISPLPSTHSHSHTHTHTHTHTSITQKNWKVS